jgi:hypothetical protein
LACTFSFCLWACGDSFSLVDLVWEMSFTLPTVNLCLHVFTPIKMMIFVKMYLTQFVLCDNQLWGLVCFNLASRVSSVSPWQCFPLAWLQVQNPTLIQVQMPLCSSSALLRPWVLCTS